MIKGAKMLVEMAIENALTSHGNEGDLTCLRFSAEESCEASAPIACHLKGDRNTTFLYRSICDNPQLTFIVIGVSSGWRRESLLSYSKGTVEILGPVNPLLGLLASNCFIKSEK